MECFPLLIAFGTEVNGHLTCMVGINSIVVVLTVRIPSLYFTLYSYHLELVTFCQVCSKLVLVLSVWVHFELIVNRRLPIVERAYEVVVDRHIYAELYVEYVVITILAYKCSFDSRDVLYTPYLIIEYYLAVCESDNILRR